MALDYRTQASDTTTQTTYTFTSVSLGAVSNDRKIIVSVIARKAGTGGTISSVTVGGVTATQIQQTTNEGGSNSNVAGLFIAEVPTGTTGNIVVTMNTAHLRCSIGVWAATKIPQLAAYDSATSQAAAPTYAIDVPAGGFVIGAGISAASTSATWSNLNEDFDSAFHSFATHAGASKIYPEAQTNLTVTQTWADSQVPASVFASFEQPLVTDWKSPSVTNTSAFVTNPDNVFASDDAYAEFNAVNDTATWGSLGSFNIPENATILGVELRVEGYRTSGVNNTMSWRVKDSGGTFRAKSLVLDESPEGHKYVGGSSDLWGGTWTPATFNNGTFQVRVAFSAASVTHYVDHVQVRVYYSNPSFDTLIDNFDDNSLDTDLWSVFSWTETSQNLQVSSVEESEALTAINSGTDYDRDRYNLAEASVFAFIELDSGYDSNDSFKFELVVDTSNRITFWRDNTLLKATREDDGNFNVEASATYNSSTHRYLRFREASGVIYWDYSSDAITWNNLASYSPQHIDVRNMYLYIYSYDLDANLTHKVRAVNFTPQTKTHTTDALKQQASTKSHSTDAFRQQITNLTHSTDAYLQELVATPTWVSPSDGATEQASDTPLVFIIPNSQFNNIHFHIQYDTADTFNTVDLIEHKSWEDQTGWEYWNGSAWVSVPASGVPDTYIGNNARYTPSDLTENTWYRRIRAMSIEE